VPPLGEEERPAEHDQCDGDVAQGPPAWPAHAQTAANARDQCVGLAVEVAVGWAVVGAAGASVAVGSWPNLNFLMSPTMSLSSLRFSMNRTCAREMIIGSFGPCASDPRLMSCVPDWSDTER